MKDRVEHVKDILSILSFQVFSLTYSILPIVANGRIRVDEPCKSFDIFTPSVNITRFIDLGYVSLDLHWIYARQASAILF